VLLSAFAIQAVDAERRARQAERSSRLQGLARGLVNDMAEVLRAPAERVKNAVQNLSGLRRPRDAAPPLTRLIQTEPLLKGFFILDASGRRVFPASRSEPEPEQLPDCVAGHVGGLLGACLPPDSALLVKLALETTDRDEAFRLLERGVLARGTPRGRMTALYYLGALYESETQSPSALLNAKEKYDRLAAYPIHALDLRGRPSAAFARFRGAFVLKALNRGDYRSRLIQLLRDLERHAYELPADAVSELAERSSAILEDPEAIEAARSLVLRRQHAEAHYARLENAFGQVLQAALRQRNPLRLSGGDLEGSVDTSTGTPFLKDHRGSEYELITYSLIPGPGGAPIGLVAVEIDGDGLQGAFDRRLVRLPGTRLVSWGEGPVDDAPDVARLSLLAPLAHLTIEVSEPEGASEGESGALDLPRETLQRWAIALSVLGVLAGVFVTTRSIRRESKAAQLKSDFVANVTHELKTPLTSIRMFLETLLLGRVEDEAEAKECLEVMNRETQRLTRLIEQLLVFSRIESRKWRVRHSWANPRELVTDAVRVLADQLGQASDELGIELVAVQDLPNIPVDRFAVVEVLLNLLHNALKYSPNDDRKVRVVITDRRGDMEIAVEDNGMGVPLRDRRRIFVKFERASNAEKSRIEGTGIGLTLASEIVRAHGGHIKYTALKPRGSRFSVFLPK